MPISRVRARCFNPSSPRSPAFSRPSPTNRGASDSNPLNVFAREPSSADETRLDTANQAIADVQIAVARPVAGAADDASWSGLAPITDAASDAAYIRSESVVPQLARTPIELEPRPSAWQRRALLVLIAALGLGIGVAGVTMVRHSARVTTSEDVSAPPSQPQSPDLAAPALPSPTILPSSVPKAPRPAVDARRPEVASARNPSVPPPLANTERPSATNCAEHACVAPQRI